VGGAWKLVGSLTYPADFDLSAGQPYVCADTGTLSLTGGNAFSGTYDSLTIACNTGGRTTGSNGVVINGALGGGTVSFNFDTPALLFVGTVHGDSMGGTVTDSVNGFAGMEVASGTWSACQGRVCH